MAKKGEGQWGKRPYLRPLLRVEGRKRILG
jgi:hypothetical protein